jgi:hypothetical protein
VCIWVYVVVAAEAWKLCAHCEVVVPMDHGFIAHEMICDGVCALSGISCPV